VAVSGDATLRSSDLGRYVLRRVAQAMFVLWAAFTVAFVIMYALPSDPAQLLVGSDNAVSSEQLDALREEFGLDRSLIAQYVGQLGDVVRGDLGRSLRSGREVTELIGEAIPPTAQVTGLALAMALIGGSTVAMVATATRSRALANLLLALPPLGVAIPSFWLGLLLVQQFSFNWAWFPALGNQGWRSVILPAVTLAVPTAALIAQVLAKSLQQTLREPYIDTARSKGATRSRVHLRHAARNAALPALTLAGIIVGNLLSGSVVTETVFSRSGLGRVTSQAVADQDLPVVQGLVLLGAAMFVTVNLAVDLLYPVFDPRIMRSPRPTRPAMSPA
jgi:peptide/nickel transport system permease protein